MIVAVAADQNPDGGGMSVKLHPVIDNCDVEAELAGMFGLELAGLQLNDDVPQLNDVEEQQVER